MINTIIFDLFGTLIGATSPELEIIKHWNLSKEEKHDGLQRVVCGTKFNGKYIPYFDSILNEAEIKITKDNRQKIKGIIEYELSKKAIIFPETIDTLNYLKNKGFKLGLISNAYPPTRKVLEKYGLDKMFDKIYLSYEIRKTKQNPDYYTDFLKKLRTFAENAIMIGDSFKSDIIASKNATEGKIGGIFISANPKQEEEKYCNNIYNKCLPVSKLSEVPAAIERYNNEYCYC